MSMSAAANNIKAAADDISLTSPIMYGKSRCYVEIETWRSKGNWCQVSEILMKNVDYINSMQVFHVSSELYFMAKLRFHSDEASRLHRRLLN